MKYNTKGPDGTVDEQDLGSKALLASFARGHLASGIDGGYRRTGNDGLRARVMVHCGPRPCHWASEYPSILDTPMPPHSACASLPTRSARASAVRSNTLRIFSICTSIPAARLARIFNGLKGQSVGIRQLKVGPDWGNDSAMLRSHTMRVWISRPLPVRPPTVGPLLARRPASPTVQVKCTTGAGSLSLLTTSLWTHSSRNRSVSRCAGACRRRRHGASAWGRRGRCATAASESPWCRYAQCLAH
jgi:hypothetical protein